MPAEPTVIRGACPHDCPDTCAWEVTVRDGVAEKLVGVKEHPFTRGGLCAKVSHFLERTYSPDRLRQPLMRSGPKGSGAFEPVSWDVALGHIAERLHAVVDEHGGEAVLPYSFAGTQGLVQGASMDRRFFACLGASRLERTICGQAAAAGQLEAAGTLVGMRPFDLLHSRFIVLWGTNTIVTNLHQWPIVQQARKAGARVVVIDPLLTRTAAAADWHVRPLPGTDAALALGLMHVIVAEDLYDAEYVAAHTEGFERLAAELAAWSPARTEEVTGVGADEVVALARAYATTRPAAIRRLIGIEHHREGARMVRTISCLPALVGAWRERGGGILGPTAWAAYSPLDQGALAGPQPETRSVNMVRLGHALTELDPPVHALVVYNSNPATTAPDSTRVMQGLARDDLFTVVLEHFMTDTARYADVVLPATTQVEHVDLVPSWGHTYVTYNEPAIAPVGDSLPNTEIFRRLARAMGFDGEAFQATDEELARAALAGARAPLDTIDFERLREVGWAEADLPEDFMPFAQGGFGTPSGRFHLWSDGLAPGFDPPPGDDEPLALMTVKSAHHFLNSTYANLPRHLAGEGEPLLELHPDDAAARGIADGDVVRVSNARGEVVARARLGDVVRPGVVALPSGWWASRSPGGTMANALTTPELTDRGGGGAFHSARVEVAPVREPIVAGANPASHPAEVP
ncbi:MAG: molybdopterin-containing oxidoreductase family protein [Solirubrobacteraceae bacterium]